MTLTERDTSNPISVLIVEDDDHIGQILKFIMERQGYQTRLATDGQAAKDAIENCSVPPDLILLDVMLPYINGYKLVELIRARAEFEKTPIVMLTAKAMEQDIVQALDAGANDYVVKPFQPNELLARVRRFLKE